MTDKQQFAQASSTTIPLLESYIRTLRARHADDLAAEITKLSECLFELRNGQLTAADNSEALRHAIADLTEANAQIQKQIEDANEFKEKVEAVASILEIVQRAVGLAIA